MGGKLKATFFLAATFAIGMVTGAAWQCHRFEHRRDRWRFVEHRVQKLRRELHLSPPQETAVRDIFEKARGRARQVNEEVAWDLSDIHRDSVRSIKGILTAEQLPKFEEIHRRMHARRNRPMEEPETVSPATDAARQTLRQARQAFHSNRHQLAPSKEPPKH